MLDQALLPERIFGLAVVEGRRTVRPGALVRFRFRARNASEIATPGARVTFVVPVGWSSNEPIVVDVPPIAPGGAHLVEFSAQPDVADESTAVSRFQAVLQLDDMALGSNVVSVRVTGGARFSAPASAVRIEPATGTRLRVAIDVVNEGDAAARKVRISAPPPPGFHADLGATVATTPELKPGESFAYAYEMDPVDPASPIVRIDDAFVTFETGRAALSTGTAYVLAPNLLPPEIASTRAATRLESTIRIANDGWVPARDVRVVVELPAGWRILRGTMLTDGAPAAIKRDPGADNGVTIVLPFVPARAAVDVSVVSSASRPRTDGTVIVRCGAHVVEAMIPNPEVRSLRLDARPDSPFAIPGGAIPISVDAFNNGETVEQIAVELDGEAVWRGEIKPGTSAAFVTRYVTPIEGHDGDRATLQLVALGDDDETLATSTIELRLIDRPWIAVEEVIVAGSEAQVIVRNVGATVARDIGIAGEPGIRVAALAPGETHAITIAVAQARSALLVAAGGAAVPIGWDVQPEAIAVAAELVVPAGARAGQRLDIRLRCTAAGALESLRVRPRPHSGAVYVAGSTAVNGYAVVDGVDGPPLLLGDGLALYDIPAGLSAEVAWSLLPRTPGDLVIAVDVEANGVAVAVDAAIVRISDAVPFGARPSALPFHIDAATVADLATAPVPLDAPAMPSASALSGRPIAMHAAAAWQVPTAPPPPGTFVLQQTLDAARLAAIGRVLRGSRAPGIVGHLPALAVLLPTAIGAEPGISEALVAATDAVRGVYERLFVKLRIPGYGVTPFDLEDNAARRALLAFLRAASTGTALPPDGSADLHVTRTSAELAAVRDALGDAPLGGSVTLAAITSLVPRGGTGELAALGAYVDHLASELAEARGLAHDAFAAYLTTHRSTGLDRARDAALRALDAPGIHVGG
jgi:hypothetical protein